MYFKNSQQLIDLFSSLEEKNLFLIQMTQDAEQNLGELRNSFNKTQTVILQCNLI